MSPLAEVFRDWQRSLISLEEEFGSPSRTGLDTTLRVQAKWEELGDGTELGILRDMPCGHVGFRRWGAQFMCGEEECGDWHDFAD